MPASKKTSKQSWLSKSIDLNSAKGRMIVSVLAFAVIGGGILVYSTFASGLSYTYTVANKTIIKGEIPSTSPCAVAGVEFGDQKNPNPGFKLKCKDSTITDPASNSAAYVVAKATPFDGTTMWRTFEMCVNARGTGDLNIIFGSADAKGVADTERQTIRTVSINSTKLSLYCGYAHSTDFLTKNLVGRVSVNKLGSNIELNKVIIREYQYSSTASTTSTTNLKN